MRRFRWSLLFLVAVAAIGVGASSVFAGSHMTKATYWNNVIAPTSGPGPAPVHYLDTATWKFGNVDALSRASEVDLNFHATVHSLQIGGGSGYGTTLSVTVAGSGTSTFTVALSNPWKPHVAYSNAPEYGQDAFGSVKLPASLWRNTGSLTVTVKSMTSSTVTYFEGDGLMIGYISVP